MENNTNKPKAIYPIIGVGLLVLLITPGLWNYYQEQQRKARIKENCRQLQALREDVAKRGATTVGMNEVMAAAREQYKCAQSQ